MQHAWLVERFAKRVAWRFDIEVENGVWTISLARSTAFVPGRVKWSAASSPGESLEFSDPPDTGRYSEYAKTQLRLIASGLGLPYNILSGDLSGTSYSSARGSA